MTNLSKEELLERADMYKRKIEKVRPLGVSDLRELDEYFRIGLTYSSNALEGNTLSISETKILIEEGITIAGKPLKDCYEAVGHAQAYDYMLEIARSKEYEISEDIIKRLHFLFYNRVDAERAGQYRQKQVYISGSEYLPPSPNEVPNLMKNFINQINSLKSKLHPIEHAAIFHKKLVDIHPFTDGNGRTARLLMNLMLINSGYGIVTISPVLRNEYITTLVISQREKNPDTEPFIKLIAECVIETQKDYCRLLRIQ